MTRYFKSTLSSLIYKFTDDAAFVKTLESPQWLETFITIDGMRTCAIEITAEEAGDL